VIRNDYEDARAVHAFGGGHLPGLLASRSSRSGENGVESRLAVRREVMAPNGFLHAATVIALADTSCGYAAWRACRRARAASPPSS
jgi:acyl-coenzyme A thioesterase PaaI-like protein